jgi:WD40-like Beta Propeller Repeat
LTGGAAEIIAPLGAWQNFTWSGAGDIVVASAGYLWRVGEKGRMTLFARPDTAAGEINLTAPMFLDDKTIAFWLQKPTADGTFRGIGVTSPAGGAYDVLDIPGDIPLAYAEQHLLVSNQNGTLTAYPVDLGKRRVTGPALTLAEGIVWIPPGGLQARVSADGSLAYVGGTSGQRLALLDGSGKTIAEAPELREYGGGDGGAAISPDGRRVAVGILRELVGGRNPAYFDTWIWDVDAKSLTRFTTDGGYVPAWTPDGKRIAYLQSTHGYGWGDAWWAPVDGSAPAEPFVKFPRGVRVRSIEFTPSGKSAVLGVIDSATAEDIYIIDVAKRDVSPVPLARTPFREMEPRISPDGRRLAYASNETGRFEVYVRPLTMSGARVKVSLGGGRLPQWASGGKRLIYTSDNGRTMAATITVVGTSVSVARQDSLLVDGVRRDVDPRTDQILVTRPPNDRRIIVVSKWLDEVRPRLVHR